MLHALQSVNPSQLMDKRWWDFKHLEAQRLTPGEDEQAEISLPWRQQAGK